MAKMKSTPQKKKRIGAALQDARIKAGFKSAKAFAAQIGINGDTYTDWEQGRHMFSYEQAWELADALHCSLDELGGREWPSAQQVLASDEQTLVDNYRRMDDSDRPAFMTTSATLAYAGDAKKEATTNLANLAE